MSDEMSDLEALDPTFTKQPRLWHVQLADESRDCDGTYPLTAHYVWARSEDEASNRADEDFDMSEGVSVTGQYDTRPADGAEVRAWLTAALQEVGGDNTETTTEWAVQERSTFDGPWARVDDGRGWSHRHGKGYTEAEARAEAATRYNNVDPALWRRVVTRAVTVWLPALTPKEGDKP